MTDGYDKPLHAPTQYKTMESPAQELDEVALDEAIADLLGNGKSAEDQPGVSHRPEFPDLMPPEPRVSRSRQHESGVGAVLRQKLAQLSGAA